MPASLWQTAKTTRGYTGHEELDEVGLVHMNGRVYDPQLGRFLSADPVVQDATDLQAFNHYAYVRNNPLSLTDPSGFSFLGGLFNAIGKFFTGVFKAVENAVKAILRNSIIRSIIQIAICAMTFESGPGICAAAAGALTSLAGGTPLQALEAFALTFVSAEVWKFEGSWTTGNGFISATGGGIGTSAATVLVHGVVGGALSLAGGGNFLQGFAAGSFGEIATQGTGQLGLSGGQNLGLRLAVVAAAGGLASQLTGGKFANGALTAAFAYLFNYCYHGGACFSDTPPSANYQDPTQGKTLAIGIANPFFAPIGGASGVALETDAAEFIVSRVNQLQAAMGAAADYVTMGVGVAEDANGVTQVIVGTSEAAGYLRPGVTIDAGELLAAGTEGHAEINILAYAGENELNLLWVGATRPICPACASFLDQAGVKAVTPLK
jgi:RHS repeat-associated protein